uniref:Uncharacterized protein n=1 Tax=Arundo donax TaxID=35708 RepID=A0A0A9EH77_ARUDO
MLILQQQQKHMLRSYLVLMTMVPGCFLGRL